MYTVKMIKVTFSIKLGNFPESCASLPPNCKAFGRLPQSKGRSRVFNKTES